MLGIGSPNSALDASDSRNWVREVVLYGPLRAFAALDMPSPSYVWWSCRYPYDPSGRYRLSVTGRLLGWRGDVAGVGLEVSTLNSFGVLDATRACCTMP